MNLKQVITNLTKRSNNNCNNMHDDDEGKHNLNKRKRSDLSRRQIRSPSPTRRNHTNYFQFSSPLNKNKNKSTIKNKVDLSNLNTNLKLDFIADIFEDHINKDSCHYNPDHNDNPFITPPSSAVDISYDMNQPPPKAPVFTKLKCNGITNRTELVHNFATLNIENRSHKIFKIPEILNKILNYVVQLEHLENESLETKYSQRLPDSYNHALLIHKDEKIARKIWNEAILQKNSQISQSNDKIIPAKVANQIKGNLFNCLMVNKLWFRLMFPLLVNELYFNSMERFQQFLCSMDVIDPNDSNCNKINSLKLNRIYDSMQLNVSKICFQNVTNLNIHICPNMDIRSSWFRHMKNLKDLSITGNKKIDNNFLINLSKSCSLIVNLDLRACERIGDTGIVAIAINCPNLKLINLGRHKNGSKVTDISIVALGKFTNVETIGLAGCNITDTGLWEFAKHNGSNVKRLSLNNCSKLTDFSIPYLLGFNYMPNLSVLEIKFLEKLNNVKYVAKFKLWRQSVNQPILIESCERITKLIDIEEQKIRKHNARTCIREMTHWVNGNDIDPSNTSNQ